MAFSYTLEQYVNDLRAITAKETDPVKITDLVAPRREIRSIARVVSPRHFVSATLSKGLAFTCFTKSRTTIWRFFWFRGCRTAAQPRTTTRLGRSLSVWRARRRRSVTTGSMTALPPGMPTLSAAANK